MFDTVVISVIFIVGIICFLVFYLRNTGTRSILLSDLNVRTEEGDVNFYEFLAKVCSETTRKVVDEKLDEVARKSFQKGYEMGFEDMREQCIRIVTDETSSSINAVKQIDYE